MAALTTNERAVKLVRLDQSIAPGRSAEALEAGQIVSLNASGEYAAGGAEGVCLTTVLTAHAPISVMKKGILELGNALSSLDYGDPVYAGADGVFDDSDASGANSQIGSVIAGHGEEPPKKLIQIDA